MARILVSSSTPPANDEANRRVQLPLRTEKRTQASTMFSTTAKNLTSDIPFRWRQGQVEIFEDWVLSRGVNAATADLVPLLRLLDLDGYESVKNMKGECVHDLIIEKVRRKINRTKDTIALQTTKAKQARTSQAQVKVEKGASEDETSVVTGAQPESTDLLVNPFMRFDKLHPSINLKQPRRERPMNEYGVDRDDTTLVNHMPPNYQDRRFVTPRGYDPGTSLTSAKGPPVNPCLSPGRLKTERLDTATKDSSYHAQVRDSQASLTSLYLSHLKAPGLDAAARDSSKHSGVHDAQALPSGPSHLASQRTPRKNNNLEAWMEKLRAGIEGITLEIASLLPDSDAAALETAAHDAALEVEHLETLVYEYVDGNPYKEAGK
ncbi:hypothetical protein F5Y09DRAFT_133389 [Xylaria sp. FL1042]|nr:hypothetical protein F5Y09DRAFT_133389 [Xylaria sp. FL1042]